MDVELAAVTRAQGTEAGWRARDVDVVLVVWRRVRRYLRCGLLLLLQMMAGVVLRCVMRGPHPLRDPTGWRMHPVLCRWREMNECFPAETAEYLKLS